MVPEPSIIDENSGHGTKCDATPVIDEVRSTCSPNQRCRIAVMLKDIERKKEMR